MAFDLISPLPVISPGANATFRMSVVVACTLDDCSEFQFDDSIQFRFSLWLDVDDVPRGNEFKLYNSNEYVSVDNGRGQKSGLA